MIEHDFKSALEEFQKFLVSNGWSKNVAWIFREGVTRYKRRWLIDINACEWAPHTKKIYELGCAKKLGIRLSAIGQACGTSYGSIWYPKDETSADFALMSGGLKLRIFTEPSIILLTQNRLWFKLIQVLDNTQRHGFFEDDLPSKTMK